MIVVANRRLCKRRLFWLATKPVDAAPVCAPLGAADNVARQADLLGSFIII